MRIFRGAAGRGGNGRNGDGTWPPTDGKGCPACGAIGNGAHGGYCPNAGHRYDENGEEHSVKGKS